LKTEQDRVDKVEEYRQTFANPYKAAELGYIDEIIFPKQTRFKLYQALELTENKTKTNPAKKHGNIPL
jgi:propionyl-CoA carboxylase beta chain